MDIRMWKNVFKTYDRDESGFLSTLELRMALNSAGYRVNSNILRTLVLRYGKKTQMGFEEFLICTVKLKSMIESFLEKDPRQTGCANFTLEEWVEKTMYN
ncbi:calpain-A-like [Limulus polyphemus]|uniref:Calpain-A-like n=1 Tax=Limulus polyphemus TaxID=6850 RepID=A0ABM1BSI3_LIMPO|nr:calpain-A-like [Limulus polyphemus]